MITQTIIRIRENGNKSNHPYMKMFRGRFELLRTIKIILRKFKIID